MSTAPKPNSLVAYHANCIDGFTSAFIAHKGLTETGHKVDLLPVSYTPADTELLIRTIDEGDYQHLYIVDFSLSVEATKQVAHMVDTTILDHHKTAFERYFPDIDIFPDSRKACVAYGAEIILDNSLSGAGLCWQYFMYNNQKAVPNLVKYVQDYDLWKYEFGNETKYINKVLKNTEQTLDNWSDLLALLDTSIGRDELLAEGEKLQAAHDYVVRNIAANAAPCELLGYAGYFTECAYEYTSDVGHTLATRPGSLFGLMFIWPTGNPATTKELVKFSIRSEGDFDVSAIAKHFDGGGHKNAAGFSVPKSTARAILTGEYCNEPS